MPYEIIRPWVSLRSATRSSHGLCDEPTIFSKANCKPAPGVPFLFSDNISKQCVVTPNSSFAKCLYTYTSYANLSPQKMDQSTAESCPIMETAQVCLVTLYSLVSNYHEFCSTVISRNRPTLENTPTYLWCSTCRYGKKHWKSSTLQEEGLTNEGRHYLHKQVHKKALQNHCIHAPGLPSSNFWSLAVCKKKKKKNRGRIMWQDSPSLLPPFFHTTSDQKLELGKAWERGNTQIELD